MLADIVKVLLVALIVCQTSEPWVCDVCLQPQQMTSCWLVQIPRSSRVKYHAGPTWFPWVLRPWQPEMLRGRQAKKNPRKQMLKLQSGRAMVARVPVTGMLVPGWLAQPSSSCWLTAAEARRSRKQPLRSWGRTWCTVPDTNPGSICLPCPFCWGCPHLSRVPHIRCKSTCDASTKSLVRKMPYPPWANCFCRASNQRCRLVAQEQLELASHYKQVTLRNNALDVWIGGHALTW